SRDPAGNLEHKDAKQLRADLDALARELEALDTERTRLDAALIDATVTRDEFAALDAYLRRRLAAAADDEAALRAALDAAASAAASSGSSGAPAAADPLATARKFIADLRAERDSLLALRSTVRAEAAA
ncbi:hypothetical protein HK405_001980, partial [Cladochytrium tenue]